MDPAADSFFLLATVAADAGAALIRRGGKFRETGLRIMNASTEYRTIAEELTREHQEFSDEHPGFV